jgi:prolyl oligopeptidase
VVSLFLTLPAQAEPGHPMPLILYGYGGFSIPLTPGFNPTLIPWLERGCGYAVVHLRGGGEYGEDWHKAGQAENKQNVFDDFLSAAEFLISEQWTTAGQLVMQGGSNGGLLVGACLNQRPDLFVAAAPSVGVMDMLRYDQFTIGWAWRGEYGDPAESPEIFQRLLSYSPYHNIKRGGTYPATLVLTGDHDDRVFPAHSFKYAAALQHAQAGKAPILLRVEMNAGHGAGKPTDKLLESVADQYAFFMEAIRQAGEKTN